MTVTRITTEPMGNAVTSDSFLLRENYCANTEIIWVGDYVTGDTRAVDCAYTWPSEIDAPKEMCPRCQERGRGGFLHYISSYLISNKKADLETTLSHIPLEYLAKVRYVIYWYVTNELHLITADNGLIAKLTLASRERKVESRTRAWINNRKNETAAESSLR